MKALSAPTIAALAASLALATLRGPAPAAQEGGQEGRRDPAPASKDEGGSDRDRKPPIPLPQQGPERPIDPIRYDVFGRRIGGEPKTFAERFLGGWRLVELVLPGSTTEGREAQGFLHVSPGFLSMEIHAAWGDPAPERAQFLQDDFHESFTAEYQILNGTRLRCLTVLGSYLDEDIGALMWETAGYERQFRISEVAGRVVMEFGALGSEPGRLVWERRLPTVDVGLDVFGRKRDLDGIKGGQDVFGRDADPGVGEPDIFGRKQRTPKEEPDGGTEGGEPAPSGGGSSGRGSSGGGSSGGDSSGGE